MTYVAKIKLHIGHSYFISLTHRYCYNDLEETSSLNQMSVIDRLILKEITSPNGSTPNFLSKKFKVHTITIARRRKRLEKEFFEKEHTFCIEKFGWRCVDFFISTTAGTTDQVANDLLELDEIIFVGKSIGQRTIDLRVEAIVKDNAHILDLLEVIEAMNGIKNAVWSEIVSIVEKKMPVLDAFHKNSMIMTIGQMFY